MDGWLGECFFCVRLNQRRSGWLGGLVELGGAIMGWLGWWIGGLMDGWANCCVGG